MKKDYSYVKIYSDIKEKIIKGDYVSGDRIVSERELATQFGVSRMTVRQAIEILVEEGYLYKHKGKGSIVTDHKIQKNNAGLTSFTEDMLKRGQKPLSKLVEFKVIDPDEQMQAVLGIEKSDLVYSIKRMRFANGAVIGYECVLQPTQYTPNLEKTFFNGQESLYANLEAHGIEITHAVQEIDAILGDDDVSEYLDIPLGSPLLLVKSTIFKGNKAVQYSKSYYRPDRYQFVQTVQRIGI